MVPSVVPGVLQKRHERMNTQEPSVIKLGEPDSICNQKSEDNKIHKS